MLRLLIPMGQTEHTRPEPRTTTPDGPPGNLLFPGQITPTSCVLVRHPTQPTMAVWEARTLPVSRSIPGVPGLLMVNKHSNPPTPERHPSLTRPTSRTLILITTPTAPSRPLEKPCPLRKKGQKLRRTQLRTQLNGCIPERTFPVTRLRPSKTLLNGQVRNPTFARRPRHLWKEKLCRPQSPMTLCNLTPLLPRCTMDELANMTPRPGKWLQYTCSLPSYLGHPNIRLTNSIPFL